MKTRHKKILKISLIVLAVLVVIFAATVFWLYSGKLTSAKNKVFQALPLPVALVNGKNVPMKDFILRYELAQKLGISQTGESDSQVKQDTYNQLITDTETAQLAAAHDVFVTQKQIDDQYLLLSSQADLQGQKDFNGLLSSYGLSETQYKSQIVKPRLLLQNLKLWFNSQTSLSQSEYASANSLVQKIQSGQDMGALAAQYTEDPSGKSAQGDLGFVQLTDILPELQEPVDNMTPGSIKIIPSQYGLHIVRLEQKIGGLYHLREIFLNTEDFGKWFAAQIQNYKIKKLLEV